jgi:hypothetical protein
MADAETTEIFPQAVSEGLRQQDLAHFGESLAWQAEDLRQARGLPEDEQVLDDSDFLYFERRYRWLKREHARLADEHHFDTLFQAQKFLQSLNRWGFSLLDMTGRAIQQFTTVLPGWYQRRIYELIHVSIPRPYARRFYNLILGHQALLSEQVHRPVKLEVAARDWYQRYHLPTILLLRQSLTQDQDPMQIYFAIMDHKWNLSLKAGREISLEDSLVDFSMEKAHTGELGTVDPARIATWWRERSPVSEALAHPSIESEELEPLVATSERPLVRLQQPELEQKLPAILHESLQPKRITTQDLEDPKS